MASASLHSLFIALAAACGALVLGWQIGMNGVLLVVPAFKNRFNKNDHLEALHTSLWALGFLPSLLLMSFGGERVGRKLPIIVSALITVLGTALALSGSKTDLALLYCGRFIAGLGTGVLCMVTPIFISEIATKDSRGKLTTVNQLMVTLGILLATFFNSLLYSLMDTNRELLWRLMLGAPILPAIALLGTVPFIPESPISLLSRGHEREAFEALKAHRRSNGKHVETEFAEMKEVMAESKKLGNATWSDILEVSIMRRLLITCALQFFQQVTGINAILNYCGEIYKSMGLSITNSNWMSVALFAVNFLATFPAMFLTDRLGRARLLQIGGIGMMLCFFATSTVFFVDSSPAEKGVVVNSDIGRYVSVAVTFVYILFFAATWGPIVWTYQSEVFPIRVRSKCAAIATSINTLANVLVLYTFPHVQRSMGEYVYVPFVVSTFVMAMFAVFSVPETKGLDSTQIDQLFAKK